MVVVFMLSQQENAFVQWLRRTFEALTPAEKKTLKPLFRILYWQIVLLFAGVFLLIFFGILSVVLGVFSLGLG